jgi:hypothetical protein
LPVVLVIWAHGGVRDQPEVLFQREIELLRVGIPEVLVEGFDGNCAESNAAALLLMRY